MPLQRLGGGAVRPALLAVQPQANQPAAAHHRDGGKLPFQAAVADLGFVQQRHIEGIVRPRHDLAGHGVRPLAHLPAIAAVDHHRADLRRRSLQEALDVGPLGEVHEPADVPGVLSGAPAK